MLTKPIKTIVSRLKAFCNAFDLAGAIRRALGRPQPNYNRIELIDAFKVACGLKQAGKGASDER